MKTRVKSAVIIAIVLLAVLFLGGYVLAGVLFAISCVGFFELSRAAGIHQNGVRCNILEVSVYVGIVIHYALTIIYRDTKVYVFSIMFVFVAVMVVYVLSYPKYNASQVADAVFSFIYAPVMLSFIYMLRIHPFGQFLAWVPFVAWVSDSFAYLIGRKFGKHKLCPLLSPNKTIEGSIAGIISSMITGVIFSFLMIAYLPANEKLDMGLIGIMLVITFFASIVSQIGDLAASGIKRNHDIKDYGHLIPGHGGIMDRFDSVIFVTPLVFFLTAVFL